MKKSYQNPIIEVLYLDDMEISTNNSTNVDFDQWMGNPDNVNQGA